MVRCMVAPSWVAGRRILGLPVTERVRRELCIRNKRERPDQPRPGRSHDASRDDIARNSVKEKLARGEVVASMTVRLVPGVEIVRIAKSAGFDTLYIDLEHRACRCRRRARSRSWRSRPASRRSCACRRTLPEYISRVLDGGALGVIAPGVRSAAEARAVVAAAKYPPLGERGLAPGLPHLQYRTLPGDGGAAGDERRDHGGACSSNRRRRSRRWRRSSPCRGWTWS